MYDGGGPLVPLTKELNYYTLEELEGVCGIIKEEALTISVCQMTLITCSMPVESRESALLYGLEYEHSPPVFSSVDDRNVPCAVCYTATRDTVVMIPAKVYCPSKWTVEYTGYLMSAHKNHYRSTYECVDKDPIQAPGNDFFNADEAYLWLVEPDCSDLNCPPYDAQKELTCVVCSR